MEVAAKAVGVAQQNQLKILTKIANDCDMIASVKIVATEINNGFKMMTTIPIHRIKGLQLIKKMRTQFSSFLANLVNQYGDIVEIKPTGFFALIIRRKILLIINPIIVKHILLDNHKNYLKFGGGRTLDKLLGKGLFTVKDWTRWKKNRNMMVPAFNQKQIEKYSQKMLETANEMVADWKNMLQEGKPINVIEQMQLLSAKIIVYTLFSFNMEKELLSRLNQIVTTLLDHNDYELTTLLQLPKFMPTKRNRKIKNSINQLTQIINEILIDHRQSSREQPDLVDMLLSAIDEETGEKLSLKTLMEEITTIFIAGYETLAIILGWCWSLLSLHPAVKEKLFHEIESVVGQRPIMFKELQQMSYAKSIIQEVLRLHPPVWLLMRTAAEKDNIGDCNIEKNSIIMLAAHQIHRDKENWSDAEEFNPDRFLANAEKDRHKYAYCPFGGGPRICIGSNFALTEGIIILTTFMQNFTIDLVSGSELGYENPTITGMRLKRDTRFNVSLK